VYDTADFLRPPRSLVITIYQVTAGNNDKIFKHPFAPPTEVRSLGVFLANPANIPEYDALSPTGKES
jgi:hypothetical protein